MGGSGSCPECPKCEQTDCDNSWSMVDSIKRIPIPGTPFTILKMDLTGMHTLNDIRSASALLRDLSAGLVLSVSPDGDYAISGKLTMIALQVPYKPKARYVYGERASYEKLKKASEVLSKVLKEYADWYILEINQSFDGSYSSVINGGELAKRYNEYQPLITKEDEANMDSLLGTATSFKDGMFGPNKGIKVSDLDPKIVALVWEDSDIPSEDLLFTPEKSGEKFRASSNGCGCLITAIIVLTLIGIGLYVLFCGGDRSVSRANASDQWRFDQPAFK